MNEFYYDAPLNLRKVQQFVYTLLEYSTFTYVIWANIENRRFKKIILYLSFIFLSTLIVFYFNVKLGKIDSVPVGIETILIFLYCFFYFYCHLNENQGKNIYNDRNFILIIGILFYLGSSFFFNILANNLSKEQLEKYWHWTWIPEIFKNILFAIGILKYSAKPKDNTTLKSSNIPYLDLI